MLPVSGAEQLNTSGAHGTRPMISHSGAYSVLLRPAPYSESGKKRFHSPCALAFVFKRVDQRDRLPAIAAGDFVAEALLVGVDVRVHEGDEARLQFPGLG